MSSVAPPFETLATAPPGSRQRLFAFALSAVFGLCALALLPFASTPLETPPGFLATYQTLLVAVYALTAFLLFAQYRRTRSVSLLVLGASGLYTAAAVFLQLLSFPKMLGDGPLFGVGTDTTIWLWTFWHLGPPIYALVFAAVDAPPRPCGDVAADRPSRRLALRRKAAIVWSTLTAVVVVALASSVFVGALPRSAEGGDYRLLMANGIGPGVEFVCLLAILVLWWRTRLRTVIQLWLAVSLLVLFADNAVTLAGGARETVGWVAGRLEALAAAAILLFVYLREIEDLYARTTETALASERARAALELARANLEMALDAAGAGDWELDLRTGRSRRTLRHDQIFGHASLLPSWSWDTFRSHVIPEDRPLLDAARDAAMRDGRLSFECRVRRHDDDAIRWIETRGKVLRDEAGRPALLTGVVLDTTERRVTAERLRQTERLEAVGQLTGGVAHDFNNLLTVVVGNLDLMRRKPDDAQRVRRLCDNALLAAQRGAELTEKLLTFSRRQPLRPETLSVNRLLTEFRPLFERAVGETVTLSMQLDPVIDPVHVDPAQFEAAILNLVVNARDALPNGGRVTISTGNVNVDLDAEPERDAHGMPPGEYVSVSVSDDGVGMDADTLARAFEPFFTTKEVGKGTGLGLSQVYGFVQQSGGRANLTSAAGAGTTVELILPRSREPNRPRRATTDEILPLRRAGDGETVLVVEDEPTLLEMAVESLGELGYRTLTATEALAALDLLRGPDRIDILFSDIVMPGGMNGVQLAVEARRLRPALKVLLTSGYMASASDRDIPEDVPLLTKPYMREDLASKLRLVMSGD